MAKHGVKEIDLQIADYIDGTNTVDRTTDVGKRYFSRYAWKQCVKSLNVTLHNMKYRKAIKAINDNVTAAIQGLDFYFQFDGTEYLLLIAGGILYSVDVATGTLTQLYNMGGSGEASFADWLDKNFVCNGSSVVKVEGNVAYQVGISPPTGVTAEAAAGGSLPDGVYKVYAGYARKVDGSNVLFSTGQLVSSGITLGSGNNTISVTSFPNSSDPQVNNKIIWMTDANLEVYYLYYQTDDNTTTSFSITDATGKKATIYSVAAEDNLVPPAFEYLIVFDKRLIGSVGNRIYWSLQEGNVYDLERFDTNLTTEGLQVTDMPFNCEGFFNIGNNLYVNTPGGVIVFPNGDPESIYEFVEPNKPNKLYFKYPGTIATWGNAVVGLTQDGVRPFTPGGFQTQDYSRDIKPDIKRIDAGYKTTARPCGIVVREHDRTEYRLYYRDPDVAGDMNNRCATLNLDHLTQSQDNRVRAAWDFHDCAANYVTINRSNVIYGAQSHTTRSVIWKEYAERNLDQNIYKAGVFETSAIPQYLVRSPSFMLDLASIVKWKQLRVLAQYVSAFNIKIVLLTKETVFTNAAINPDSTVAFVLGKSRLDIDTLSANNPQVFKKGIKRSTKGNAVYVEIDQTLEDNNFELLELGIYGVQKKTRRT